MYQSHPSTDDLRFEPLNLEDNLKAHVDYITATCSGHPRKVLY